MQFVSITLKLEFKITRKTPLIKVLLHIKLTSNCNSDCKIVYMYLDYSLHAPISANKNSVTLSHNSHSLPHQRNQLPCKLNK